MRKRRCRASLGMGACDGGSEPSPSPPPQEGDGGSAPGGGGPAPGGGDGGGGTPSGACAGLAPALGDAVELRFDTGTHSRCEVATTSASGQIALGLFRAGAGFPGIVFRLYPADGSVAVGTIDGVQDMGPTDDVDPWFHPTARGYRGMVHPGSGASPLPFRTWDTSGNVLGETEGHAVSSAPDRNGGSVLLERAFDRSSPAEPVETTRLEWIDASGVIARAVTLDRAPRFVLSSWATGHAVVVVPGSPGSARWFDESGSALTPWFDVGDVSERSSLRLLVDGTVALRSDGRWQVALPDGVASTGVVPAWLASRPSTRLATIRGGRAYAVLPMESSGDAARFEIVAASGESCGSFSIPAAPVLPREEKSPRRLDVGHDGTLLQTSDLAVSPPTFGGHCTFRWWPQLLR